MNVLRVALLAAMLSGCAAEVSRPTPTYDYSTDVRVGLEAESIGNWSLARSFLEEALTSDHIARAGGLGNSAGELRHEHRMEAARALARIYFEQGETGQLYEHLHSYWPVKTGMAGFLQDEDEREEHLAYHLRWYCKLLDVQQRYADAQACWNKLGEDELSRAAIRAMEMQDVFRRR